MESNVTCSVYSILLTFSYSSELWSSLSLPSRLIPATVIPSTNYHSSNSIPSSNQPEKFYKTMTQSSAIQPVVTIFFFRTRQTTGQKCMPVSVSGMAYQPIPILSQIPYITNSHSYEWNPTSSFSTHTTTLIVHLKILFCTTQCNASIQTIF